MTELDTFDALQQEQESLEKVLESLDKGAWEKESLCPGWTVADVVLHLAQTEEAVVAAVEGGAAPFPLPEGAQTVDEVVDHWVRTERGKPAHEVLDRWKTARRDALAGLRSADPSQPLQWAAAPLKARTLATTRLAEHWAHANDIAEPLTIPYPDTDRLWHIAWLAHKTIPYAFMRSGRSDPPSVYAELTSPVGETWTFGSQDAACTVRGKASEFCRVAARRMSPDDASDLNATGERADQVLELVRTYA